MTKPAWPERLAKTISKLSPKSNVAQFRDEYAEIVRSVPDDKKSNSREVLLELRPAIESWVTEEDKCPCCALREWTKFYDAAGSMPVSLLIAIAKKLPQTKSGTVDWQPFFFNCRHKALLTTLFDRRTVAKGHLQSWVSDKLRDAYPLPVLDLAIDNDADEKQVDARRRMNQDLVRGGSAIGGCSVAVDLPIRAPVGGAARVQW